MDTRELLDGIFREALARCDAGDRVSNLIEPRDGDKGFAVPSARFDVKLAAPGKLWLFGAGKAALKMAAGVAAKLGPQIKGGVLIAPEAQRGQAAPALAGVEILYGDHPDPSPASVESTLALVAAAGRCSSDDHAIFVLSGGASALLSQPVRGLPVDVKARLAHALMAAGAPIAELNVVRKHLSQVKGGQLAARFGCGVTVLVLSDVAGNFLDTIGSGPFEPDLSTRARALQILETRLGPDRVADELRGCLVETPKESHAGVRHVLVGSPRNLADAAAVVARERGLSLVGVDGVAMEDAVEDLAEGYGRRLRMGAPRGTELVIRFGEPVMRTPAALRAGVLGGRSEHLALLVARAGKGLSSWALLACGSDGLDGSSDAAGAIVDGATWGLIEARGVNPLKKLENYDSHRALDAGGALVRTGPTGNNLLDLHLLLVHKG